MFPIKNAVPTRYPPLVTWALITVNCAVFLFELSLSPGEVATLRPGPSAIFSPYSDTGLSPVDYLPFLTMMFLHGGWLHLILNMWTLWLFGPAIEDRMGHGRYFAFYFSPFRRLAEQNVIYGRAAVGCKIPTFSPTRLALRFRSAYYEKMPSWSRQVMTTGEFHELVMLIDEFGGVDLAIIRIDPSIRATPNATGMAAIPFMRARGSMEPTRSFRLRQTAKFSVLSIHKREGLRPPLGPHSSTSWPGAKVDKRLRANRTEAAVSAK